MRFPGGLDEPSSWVRAGAFCHLATSRFTALVVLRGKEKTSGQGLPIDPPAPTTSGLSTSHPPSEEPLLGETGRA